MRVIFPKIFFGWLTVMAGGFLSLWGYGFYFVGFSALFKPIALELGFSRAGTSVAASIGSFEGGFQAPVTGWIIDRFGPKTMIILGTFIIGLGLILMNFIDSLWAFYLVYGGLVGTGCNIALSLPLDKAISDWFVKKRGLALSVRWVFQGLAAIVVLPLISWLITLQGWRMTCVVGGVVMWLVGLPLAWFFIKRNRPEYYDLLPDGATVEKKATDTSQMIGKGVEYAAEVQEVEFTLRQAIRTPAYWLLIVAYCSFIMIVTTVPVHGVPFLTDMGIDPLNAALIIAMTAATTIPMRFVGGFLVDRVKKEYLGFILAAGLFIEAAGIIAFLLSQTVAMAYVFFILYFIGFGIGLPSNTAIKARYFGRKGFGSIQGSSTMMSAPFGVLAPIYAGWVYDTTGSYINAFTLYASLLALCTVILLFIRPPKPPAYVSDIRKFL